MPRNHRAALLFLVLSTLALPAFAGVGVWTPLGPEGGSVWSLAVDPHDPDVVYAGTLNGVFRSADAGATWSPASKGLGPAGQWVWSLAVTRDAVLAGTNGPGVYRSSDGGATWQPSSAGIAANSFFIHVGDLAVDPGSPDRVWAATNTGVYLTTNGGRSWQARRRGLPTDAVTMALALAPDGSTLYAAGPRGAFRTTNQGKAWFRMSKGLPEVAFVDVTVDPAVPGNVFVAGPGLWRSTNGGARWTRVNPAVFDGGVQTLAWQGKRLFVGLSGAKHHGIWFSDDHGATWTAAAENPSDPAIEVIAAGPGLVYAGTRGETKVGGVFRSLDRGRHWDQSIAGFISLEAQSVAVDPSDPDVLYAGVERLGLFKSTARGHTWQRLDLGAPYSQIRFVTVLVDPSDPSTVYAGTGESLPRGLFRSQDAGASWEKIDIPLNVEVLAADPRTPGAVWAAGLAGLYHSDDFGETWERVPIPDAVTVWLRALQVDPHDPAVLWAAGTIADYGPAGGVRYHLRLFRSADGGQTWERREAGLFGTMVFAVAVDPANSDLVLAGTDSGLFRTADAGHAWTKVPGFSAAVNAIVAIVAAPTTPTAFYANLSGFGVQRGIVDGDGGLTWAPARRGLAPVLVDTLTVDPGDPRHLYAGTLTRGVFEYTEP